MPATGSGPLAGPMTGSGGHPVNTGTSSHNERLRLLGPRLRGDDARYGFVSGSASRICSSRSCFGVTSEGAPISRSSAF